MTRESVAATSVYSLGCRVCITRDSVVIYASPSALYEWSIRPGASWSCGVLADLDALSAEFDSGGLVDLQISHDDADALRALGISQIPGDELSAFCSDVLRPVLPTEHPCYFATVGQFGDDAL